MISQINISKSSLIVILLIPGVLLFLAPIIKFPYGYYTFMRIFVFITAAWYIFSSIVINKSIGVVSTVFFIILILYNPFIQIHLSREIWAPLNFISASIYFWMFFKTMKAARNY